MSNLVNVSPGALQQALTSAGIRPGSDIQSAAQNTSFPKPVQLPSVQASVDNNPILQIVSQLLEVVSTLITLLKDVLSPGAQKPSLNTPRPQTAVGGDLPSALSFGNPGLLSGQGVSGSVFPRPSSSIQSSMTPPLSDFEQGIREFAGILTAIEETAPKIPDAVESIGEAGAETWDYFFGSDEDETVTVQ